MLLEDRKALAGIVIGLAGGVLTSAGPLAFPQSPPVLWVVSFLLSAIVFMGCGCVLIYDFVIRPRKKEGALDPILGFAALCALACLVAIAVSAMRVKPGPDQAGQLSQLEAQLASQSQQLDQTRGRLAQAEGQLATTQGQLRSGVEQSHLMAAAAKASTASYPQTFGTICGSNLINVAEAMLRTLAPESVILITAPSENEQFKRNILGLFTMAMQRVPEKKIGIFISPPNYEVELDAPKLIGTSQRGITFHGEDAPPGHFMIGFGQQTFVVRKTSQIPEGLAQFYKAPNVIWIDIGPGSPWVDPSSCRE